MTDLNKQTKSDPEIKVTDDDIASFASRLSSWSESLSTSDQSLAHVLLQYTRDLRPEDVRRRQLVDELDVAMRAAVQNARDRWNRQGLETAAWVEVGPIWQKANPPEARDQYEIVTWTYTRPEGWTPPYA